MSMVILYTVYRVYQLHAKDNGGYFGLRSPSLSSQAGSAKALLSLVGSTQAPLSSVGFLGSRHENGPI